MATNNAINLNSAGVCTYDGAGTFSASTITQNAVLSGGASNAIVSNTLTNGQLLIGSTGAAPVPAGITAGAGISVTPGAGSISISSTGGGFSWNVVTSATQTAVAHNAYIANYAGTCVITLPATSAVGDTITISGMNTATGWKIAQPNAASQIFFGSASTTLGTGGYLQSTAIYDTVTLTCNVANATWIVTSSIGNVTVN
jgi:hypothetical protein